MDSMPGLSTPVRKGLYRTYDTDYYPFETYRSLRFKIESRQLFLLLAETQTFPVSLLR